MGILNFPFRSGSFPLPWFPRSGSEAQRARRPTPGSRVGRGKAGKGLVSPTVLVARQVEGWGREDMWRRNDWGLREVPAASPTHPHSTPQSSTCSPRPRPRTRTRSA